MQERWAVSDTASRPISQVFSLITAGILAGEPRGELKEAVSEKIHKTLEKFVAFLWGAWHYERSSGAEQRQTVVEQCTKPTAIQFSNSAKW
jgi:hypothetical protein